MKRETTKQVEVMGRKFEIRKFDAYTGSYLLFQLFEKFLPAGIENKVSTDGGSLAEKLPGGRSSMSKAEFISFQRDCLSVVGEILPARTAPVLNENGSWGIEDLANNTMLAILLTIHALTFNLSDFFGEEGLKELRTSLSGISLASLRT